jgi:NADP-dependent 3-hydroxy acid dehydrogenase YdfG
MSTASKPATAAFALVTGASPGIGTIDADRLAKRGHDLSSGGAQRRPPASAGRQDRRLSIEGD